MTTKTTTEQSFEARTTAWDARLTTTAQAARSALAVDRMPADSPERRAALRQHTTDFASPLRSSCARR